MATRKTTMPYGKPASLSRTAIFKPIIVVRLGNSGLKVSKIILGAMSYGDTRWAAWTLGEEEAIKHIKTA